MKHRRSAVLAGLTAALLSLSCDEGRLVTGAELEPLQATLLDLQGPDTLLVAEGVTFSTGVMLGTARVTAGVLRWSATPPGILVFDTARTLDTLPLTARSPGTATLTAAIHDPEFEPAQAETTVTVVLDRIARVTPSARDTTITSLGAELLLRVRGMGAGSAAADSAGIEWSHHGQALELVRPLALLDTVRVRAVARGTDTLTFKQDQSLCIGTPCADTIYVHVDPAVATVQVSPARDTLRAVGKTTQLTALVQDGGGTELGDVPVTWASLDEAVATVTGDGLVTAVAQGEATVTATAGGVAGTATVVVWPVAKTLAVSPKPVTDTLLHGSTVQLVVAAVDSNDVDIPSPDVSWTVSKSGVVAVDGTGLVAGLDVAALDSAWVRAVSGGASDSVRVFVDVTEFVAVSVTPATVTLDALTDTVRLVASALNQRGEAIPGHTFAWTSRDEAVATVHTISGLVTTVANGATYVIATADADPAMVDSALVVVEQAIATVEVEPATHTFTALGDVQEFTAQALDARGVEVPGAVFSWSRKPVDAVSLSAPTSDSTVDVTAEAAGAATLTATETATGSDVEGTAQVNVEQLPETLEITPSLDTIGVGGTTTLVATVRDANGVAIPDSPVNWSSLDETVATVDEAGVVTGVTAPDSAGIVAVSTLDPGVVDTAQVTVLPSVLEFDGGDYAQAGDVLDLDEASHPAWTIEIWVKPATIAGNQYLLAKGGAVGNANASAYGLYLKTGRPTFFARDGSGLNRFDEIEAPSELTMDEWHHVAVTFDHSTLTAEIYVNGVVAATKELTRAPRNVDGELFLGASSVEAANAFAGRLDEIRYWSVLREQVDIEANYRTPLAGNVAGLMAYWPLTEGSGNPVDTFASRVFTLGTDPRTPTWRLEIPEIP